MRFIGLVGYIATSLRALLCLTADQIEELKVGVCQEFDWDGVEVRSLMINTFEGRVAIPAAFVFFFFSLPHSISNTLQHKLYTKHTFLRL
jgi:hypothetical protein